MTRSLLATAALWLTLAACPGAHLPGTSYRPNAEDTRLFDELEARWDHAELDTIGRRCAEDRAILRVVVAETEDYSRLCTGWCPTRLCPSGRASERCGWGCRDACFVDPCVGSWPHCIGTGNEGAGGRETPLIVVHVDAAPDGYPHASTLAHEYLHFLGTCTGRGEDRNHVDQQRWDIL